jgi:hypothetical protein
MIPFRFRVSESPELLEQRLLHHVRSVSAFADSKEIATGDRDREWIEPRMQGAVRSDSFRLWLSKQSRLRDNEVRELPDGVVHGRVRRAEGVTIVSGIARPSAAAIFPIGIIAFAIMNPFFPLVRAPAAIQIGVYVVFMVALSRPNAWECADARKRTGPRTIHSRLE